MLIAFRSYAFKLISHSHILIFTVCLCLMSSFFCMPARFLRQRRVLLPSALFGPDVQRRVQGPGCSLFLWWLLYMDKCGNSLVDG